MLVKRIGVLSLGKMLSVLYGGIGLLGGLCVAVFFFVGGDIAQQQQAGVPTAIAGVAGLILVPLFYGVAGFIGGIITAALYNFVGE
jgi:hypothetical protein